MTSKEFDNDMKDIGVKIDSLITKWGHEYFNYPRVNKNGTPKSRQSIDICCLNRLESVLARIQQLYELDRMDKFIKEEKMLEARMKNI